jgi:hypothetical protein
MTKSLWLAFDAGVSTYIPAYSIVMANCSVRSAHAP